MGNNENKGVKRIALGLIVLFVLIAFPEGRDRASIRVAVASNFIGAMKKIATAFEKQTGLTVTVVPGSTGKHFAQISNGADFDLFFAADSERPSLLTGERRTYAIGRLVLWSARNNVVDDSGQVLKELGERRLALANPKLAPYGRAAIEVLETLEAIPGHIMGENVAQTFQYIHGGHADLGFIAMSQIIDKNEGSLWIVPESMYTPIEQQVVLLNEHNEARQFFDFVQRKEICALIRQQGYVVP